LANAGLIIINSTSFAPLASTSSDFNGGQFSYALCYSRDQTKIYYNIHVGNNIGTRPLSWSNSQITLDPIIATSLTLVYNIDISFDGSKLIRCGSEGF